MTGNYPAGDSNLHVNQIDHVNELRDKLLSSTQPSGPMISENIGNINASLCLSCWGPIISLKKRHRQSNFLLLMSRETKQRRIIVLHYSVSVIAVLET